MTPIEALIIHSTVCDERKSLSMKLYNEASMVLESEYDRLYNESEEKYLEEQLEKIKSKKSGSPKGRPISTIEGWMMANGKSKESFLSYKSDKDITAIAVAYNRKVKTEKLTAIKKGNSPIAFSITRVTLL